MGGPNSKPTLRAHHTAQSATQWRSNLVSRACLRKMGIFGVVAGDFRQIRPAIREIGKLDTARRIAKARHWRAFLRPLGVVSPVAGLAGWGGRIRTFAWWRHRA